MMNQLSEPVAGREPIRLSEEGDFGLGSITVRPSLREVCWDGCREQLEPRVMQVLVALARGGGNVVSRDELIRLCWEGRIVGEAAINRCILKLRDLADAAGNQAYRIETIPRVGYRLLSDPAGATSEPHVPAPGTDAVRSKGRHPRSALAAGLGLLLVASAAFAVYEFGFRMRPGAPPPASTSRPFAQPSIAVLPFKNLSSDTDTGYLAAGIQDEILTRLANIGSLKVISRTSADQYANKAVGIRAIARQLGVANILEGSVQKSGDKVRINVQLIRAATDNHLWAEDYDRTLVNILSVESDVAGAIADALAAKVTPGERRELNERPTSNPRAYDLYLRALVFAHKNDDASLNTAVQLFQRAVAADPKFALAWAWLARMQAYTHFGDRLAAVRSGAAHAALAKALALQPGTADTQAALGFYLYYGEMNYPAAERELIRVHARWPNNAEALEALALIERRLGKWKESSDDLARLISLDPLVSFHRATLAGDLMILHDYSRALGVLDDALKIWPDNGLLLASKATLYQSTGKLDLAEAVLKNVHPAPDDGNLYWPVMEQFWLRHQYAKGAAYFRGLLAIAQEHDNPESVSYILRIALGEFLRMEGDQKGASENYSQAIAYITRELKNQPGNSELLIPLSVAYAGLGDSAKALRTADQSIALFRKMDDQLDAYDAENNHMALMVRFGDHAAAIREIQLSLKAPGGENPATLRLDPTFDALRGDPRFKKLLTVAASH
jgi:TolB-like protein/DNA-binding winged helix-turn-helix (wHTH) protein/predicted Zn-dependent protease